MKAKIALLSIVLLVLSGCSSVPITGRKQLNLVGDQEILSASFQQYGEFIKEAPLSNNATQTALVKKVGQRIATAVETYLKNNGMADEVQNYKWEFHLVKSNEVNAWCMPGGKIVVYEGILPYTQDETGLAVVMGHEVAHAVAKHSNERMSQEMIKQKGSAILSTAMGGSSVIAQQAASVVYGLGSQGVMLKYSRNHELEADHLGLIFMAMAGYDPSFAAGFWQRMAAGGAGGTPEFMSTHPSDNTRVSEINKHLPEVMPYYTGAKGVKAKQAQPTNTKSAKTSKEWTF